MKNYCEVIDKQVMYVIMCKNPFLHLFQDVELFKNENAMDTDSSDVKDTLQAEKDVCFVLFTKFTKEVSTHESRTFSTKTIPQIKSR
jgi:hypothetical protein